MTTNELTDDVLDEVVGEVAESMVFSYAEPTPAPLDKAASDLCWSRIDLIAPASGSMVVVANADTAAAMFDALWAGEVPSTDEAVEGFMDELANAIGGQVLARIDPEAPARLGLPIAGRGPLPAGQGQSLRVYELEGAGLLGIAYTPN